jgi:hypothetical protein
MTELIELPPELLVLITSFADTKSLKSLRLTNRLLSSYASRYLFRVVHLYDDDESCEAFKSVISHPSFKSHVQRIHLNTVEDDYVSPTNSLRIRTEHAAVQLRRNVDVRARS